jgi:hypothetical protein
VLLAPGEVLSDDVGHRLLRIDRSGVDVEQGGLLREPAPALRMPVLLPDEIDQIGGVTRVEDTEAGREPESARMQSNELVGHGVERAAHDRGRDGRQANVGPGALEHLARRPARERQQQNPLGRDAYGNEPCHPCAQRRGLPSTSPSQDQQRTLRVGRGLSLLWIEVLKPMSLGRGRC